MQELTNVSVIRDVLTRHGFTFSKSLGQNFLINPSVCPKMAAACHPGIDTPFGVLEIGPGVGVLTKELAAVAEKVVAIELDDRLFPVLNETLADCQNVTLIRGDAMKLDLRALLCEQFGPLPVVVCANLPYYITSPLLMKLLESRLPLSCITVLVQKEAATRLCAAAGTRECGSVTLAVRYFAEPSILFSVSRGSFLPAPKVDSSVIQLKLHKTPPVSPADERLFFDLIHAAFQKRRKTLANSLCGAGFEKPTVLRALETAGLSPTARAEELTLEQYAALTSCFTV